MLQDYAFGTPEDSLYTANFLESFLSKKHPEYGHDKIDKIIVESQILALLETKNKIQEKIEELEKQKDGDEDVPF